MGFPLTPRSMIYYINALTDQSKAISNETAIWWRQRFRRFPEIVEKWNVKFSAFCNII